MIEGGTVVVESPSYGDSITEGSHGFKRTPQSIFSPNKQQQQQNPKPTK